MEIIIDNVDFPTAWQMYDGMARVEFRQLSLDTYQVRWPEGQMTLDAEGFNIYRTGGIVAAKYLSTHDVKIEPRNG